MNSTERCRVPHRVLHRQLRQKLLDVGLPVGGGKAAMISRHKRLALLDAASGDRDVPVPRRELIRQVDIWEVSGGARSVKSDRKSLRIDGRALSDGRKGEWEGKV